MNCSWQFYELSGYGKIQSYWHGDWTLVLAALITGQVSSTNNLESPKCESCRTYGVNGTSQHWWFGRFWSPARVTRSSGPRIEMCRSLMHHHFRKFGRFINVPLFSPSTTIMFSTNKNSQKKVSCKAYYTTNINHCPLSFWRESKIWCWSCCFWSPKSLRWDYIGILDYYWWPIREEINL